MTTRLEVASARPRSLGGGAATAAVNVSDDSPAVLADVTRAATLLSVVAWAIVVTGMFGGRNPHALTLGTVLSAPAIGLLAYQGALAVVDMAIVVGIGLPVLGVCLLAPSGWDGMPVGADYVCAAWLFCIVRAAGRRDLHIVRDVPRCFTAAVLLESVRAIHSWTSAGNARAPMTGNFGMHNQLAVFCAAGAIVGLGMWLESGGWSRAFGLVTFSLSSSCVVFSTSRATLGCLMLGVALLVISASRVDTVRLSATRAAIALTSTVATVVVLTRPPFFDTASSPFAATAARASHQSLAQNGGYRIQAWHEAVAVFVHHWSVGGGFRHMGSLARPLVPRSYVGFSTAFSGYLQMLADGGLLLALPVFAVLLLVAVRAVRSIASAVRWSAGDPVAIAVAVAVLVLLGHSAVDYDWTFPALQAALALLAATMFTGNRSSEEPSRSSQPIWHRYTLQAVGVALLALVAVTSWPGQMSLSVPVHNVGSAT